MKKNCLHNIVRGCFFFFCLFLSSNQAFATNQDTNDLSSSGHFAQLSSSVTQNPGIASKLVKFENVDQLDGLKVDSAREKITVKESGLYFIMANGRVGTSVVSIRGRAEIYLLRNGTQIPRTGASYISPGKIMTTNVISQTVLFLKKGDHISVGITSDSPIIGLIPSSGTQAIPSITFTMYKINN